FSSRRRHTRSKRDWSSDVCSSDLTKQVVAKTRSAATRTDHGGGAMYDEIVYLLMASGSLHPTRRGGSPRDVHHPGYRPRPPQSRSEERRVGKEGRSRGAPGQWTKR